jgi:Ca-activated chloride channel family protein
MAHGRHGSALCRVWLADDGVADGAVSYFAYPSMAPWLLVVLALWLSAGWLARRRQKILEVLGHPNTIRRMFPAELRRRRRWSATLRILGLFCFAIALAGPLIGSKLVEFKQKGLDIFIAIDCSLSMQAEDLKPNRMAHAKLILAQLIDRLAGSRIGLIAFAGQAYVECPLTIDENAAKDVLETIDVGSVPIPGTVIGDAVRVAIKGLKAGEGQNRVLVLLTDGEDHHSDPEAAAKEAAKVGLKIFPIGIGTPQGEPIPILDDQGHRTGYKRDKKGEVVLSRLDEQTLIDLAHETGGQYYRATPTGDEAEDLARALDQIQQGDQKTRLFNRFENRYQWPLGIGLLFLMISLAIPEMGWRKP